MFFFPIVAASPIINESNVLQSNKSAFEYIASKEQKSGLYSFKTKNCLGIIQLPPKKEIQTYAELPGSSYEDQKKIIELISTMGSHNKVILLLKHKSRLEQLGKEIEHVHPLKLLGVIFSTPNMKQYMDDVYNDYFKWKNFIEGLEPNLDRELRKHNLLAYIEDFASNVNVPSENIKPFFENRDWRGLVKYLIYN